MYTARQLFGLSSNTTSSQAAMPLPLLYPASQRPLPKLDIAPDQASLLSDLCPLSQLLPFLPLTSLLVPHSPRGPFMVVLFKSSFHEVSSESCVLTRL